MARCAVLIDGGDVEVSRAASRRLASQQKSQVAVLDRTDIVEIMLRQRPTAWRYFIQAILKWIDLSLVSPFVSEGPTPNEMFFGRESEIRRIIEQARNQSFALVGGRKVGKTSILRRLQLALPDRTQVVYVDCQAHPDRQDFLQHLVSLTDPAVRSESDVHVTRAESTLRSFLKSRFGDRFGVILLDEVDELFHADSQAGEYRHILSRALRSLSQSSTATIVATGERALFELTMDPNSPHWNFCTPLKVGPLSEKPATDLIKIPLNALGIQISEDALRAAVARTACHPNLLQFLGNQIVEKLSPQSGAGMPLEIRLSQINDLVGSPGFRNRFVLTFWSRATTLEKLISLELSSRTASTVETLESAFATKGLRVHGADIQRALSFLELYSVACQQPDGWTFASDAFDTFFKPLAATAVVRQWREELK